MVFTKYSSKNSLETISRFLKCRNAPESAIPFDGGIIGYLGYDSVRPALGMGWKNPDPISLPHSIFLTVQKFYTSKGGELEAVYCARVEDVAEKAYFHAIEEVDAMAQLPIPEKIVREPRLTKVRANMSKKEFVKLVRDTKNRIFKGEIEQAIISRKISCKAGDPLVIYSKLRNLNPCPYIFYLRVGDGAILGSSPENFLTIRGTAAESCPVASTRQRGETAAEDRKLELELVKNLKETSEHEMLFKACVQEFKDACTNVRVVEKMRIKKFPFFMHLVSKVCGRTHNPFKLLKVSFPSVTIAGVPKKRAMEIIDEIEPDARGVYCGSFGYVSNSGNLDMGIVVRSILINKGRAFVPVGAGIVSRSVPKAEYMETFYKARAQLLALGAEQADMKWLAEL
jgi:anthranilate synthase component 1